MGFGLLATYDYYPFGFPFTIVAMGYCPPTGICQPFSMANFVADLAIGYVVSVFITYLLMSIMQLNKTKRLTTAIR